MSEYETRWVPASSLYGGDVILINGRPVEVWSIAHGVKTVRVTFDVPGQRKADSRARFQRDCTVRKVVGDGRRDAVVEARRAD